MEVTLTDRSQVIRRDPEILGRHASLRELVDPARGVMTVVERGWGGVTNGKLLARAEHQFDVLVTMDQNLQYQQNLSDFDLAVVVIKPGETVRRTWSRRWHR